MLYEFDDLYDEAMDIAIQEYWDSCLDSPDHDLWVSKLMEIVEEYMTPAFDYFDDLYGAKVSFTSGAPIWLAGNIQLDVGLGDGVYASNVLEAEIEDPIRCVSSESVEAFDNGVPYEDIYWVFNLPDIRDIDRGTEFENHTVEYFDQEVEKHMSWLDGRLDSLYSFDKASSAIEEAFSDLVCLGSSLFLSEKSFEIASDLSCELLPDLRNLGAVFDEDGSIPDQDF